MLLLRLRKPSPDAGAGGPAEAEEEEEGGEFMSLEEKVVSICLVMSLNSPFFLAMTELKNLDVPSARLSDSERLSSRVRCRGWGWGWD